MANVLTLDNINVEGKTVLLRVDINSPLDPATKSFLDDTRIRAILPTLNRLSKAKTVLIAHQSRPGKNDFTSTLGHARELGRLLGRSIRWVQLRRQTTRRSLRTKRPAPDTRFGSSSPGPARTTRRVRSCCRGRFRATRGRRVRRSL